MRPGTSWAVAALLAGASCAPGPPEGGAGGAPVETREGAGAADAYIRPSAGGGDPLQGDTVPGFPSWTRQDLDVLRQMVGWAWSQRIDTLPIGQRLARIGEAFVGATYLPQTLDPPGPERLVVTLRAFDCVTYIESMLVLAHFVRDAPRDILDRQEQAMELYQELLTRIRYRGGQLAGYPSRLHYFSEWLRDNERKGLVELVTEELGGDVDPEPISFMTSHRDAYRQLEDADVYTDIARIETTLSSTRRHYIPQERLERVVDRIRTGDIIAATSTLAGLDVAHTGIALWKDGEVRLMHAPLVGSSVEISDSPLAERLRGIATQDGVMVARPR